jgi:hypothetical protein
MIIIIIIISIIIIKNKYNTDRNTYVCFTTIPDRISNKWVYNSIKRLLTITKNYKVHLYIPYISTKGIPYIIPQNIHDLENEQFSIIRCEEDEGPITKLLPALRNDIIKDNDIIIICDDDHHYKENMFYKLHKTIVKNPSGISTNCRKDIAGYAGFGFVKKTLTGLLSVKIPKICRDIDDDVIQMYVNKNNIPTYLTSFFKKGGHCSLDLSINFGQPDWTSLNAGPRKSIQEKCMPILSNVLDKHMKTLS